MYVPEIDQDRGWRVMSSAMRHLIFAMPVGSLGGARIDLVFRLRGSGGPSSWDGGANAGSALPVIASLPSCALLAEGEKKGLNSTRAGDALTATSPSGFLN
jgi:hypothetical protein